MATTRTGLRASFGAVDYVVSPPHESVEMTLKGFSGLPMPYDLNIYAMGAGTTEVVYNVPPGKPGQPTRAELEEFKSKKPIGEVVARLLETQNVSEVGQGT